MAEMLFLIYIKSTARIITQDIITFTVNVFIDFINQYYKDISCFIYVTNFEIGIVIFSNPVGRINLECVGIKRTGYLLADNI